MTLQKADLEMPQSIKHHLREFSTSFSAISAQYVSPADIGSDFLLEDLKGYIEWKDNAKKTIQKCLFKSSLIYL